MRTQVRHAFGLVTAVSSVSLMFVCGAQSASAQSVPTMDSLARTIEAQQKHLDELSAEIKANREVLKNAQAEAAANAAKAAAAVDAAKAEAAKAEAAARSVKTAGAEPKPSTLADITDALMPENATLQNKKAEAAPNIIFEPLQPHMNLISDKKTWLGLYGTGEADIMSTSHQGKKGGNQTGFDQAPWMSADRLGVAGAHRLDDQLGGGLDAIVRLEAEYYLPTGSQDTANTLFNRDAWIGLQSKDWGKLTVGRQNSLGRDAIQWFAAPYGSWFANYSEGGWINNPRTEAMKEYVGVATGSRADSAVVYKKLTGPLYTAVMYQFGSPSGTLAGGAPGPGNNGRAGMSNPDKFPQGSAEGVALGYDFGNYNVGGYYTHANVNGMPNQTWIVGGNYKLTHDVRLNGGFLRYQATQEANATRFDNAWFVSGIYQPNQYWDYALAYNYMHAKNALQDANGFTLDPHSDTSLLGGSNGIVSSGERHTWYGSVRYKFDYYASAFVGFTYTRLTNGFHYNAMQPKSGGGYYSDLYDIGTGIVYNF